jgi:tetratricopeptide (TPR) repeat protein
MSLDRDAEIRRAIDAFKVGQFKDAQKIYANVAKSFPEDLDLKLLLGIAASKAGDTRSAIEHLQSVVKKDPRNADALGALSHCLRSEGDFGEATRIGEQAVAVRPNDPQALHNLGRCYLAEGRTEESIYPLQRTIAIEPRQPSAHFHLAVAYQKLGRVVEAVAAYQQSISLAPNAPQAYAGLAELYMNHGHFDGAIQCLKRCYELEPNTSRGQVRLGMALAEEGRFDDAETTAWKALELDGDSDEAHSLLGRVLQQRGRFEQAEEHLQRALDLNPSKAGPLYRLVSGRKIKSEDRELIQRMSAMLNNPNLTESDHALLEYSFGKACDDLGDYAQAIRHYDIANAIELDKLERTGRGYEPEEQRAEIDGIVRAYTPELFQKAAGQGVLDVTPILIVGMERSGTSLIEQILSSHSRVSGAGEVSFWTQQGRLAQPEILAGLADGQDQREALHSLANSYLATLAPHRAGLDRVTDKMPANLAMVGLIHLAMPNVRILYCKRHAVDNCLSIYLTAFRSGSAYLYSRPNIVNAYRQHLRLADHFHAVIPADRFLEVRYEDLVDDKVSVLRRILEFLDLDWDDRVLRHEENAHGVKTPSLWQARQPIYRSSVARWRNYEPWLAEFRGLFEEHNPDDLPV